jgi:hypothetical protein
MSVSGCPTGGSHCRRASCCRASHQLRACRCARVDLPAVDSEACASRLGCTHRRASSSMHACMHAVRLKRLLNAFCMMIISTACAFFPVHVLYFGENPDILLNAFFMMIISTACAFFPVHVLYFGETPDILLNAFCMMIISTACAFFPYTCSILVKTLTYC